MANKNYADKLKSPKWQKKRLEIYNRDGFKCQECGESENTLHVHHKYYLKDKDPWDYPNEAFTTLCEFCHESTHEHAKQRESDFIIFLYNLGLSTNEFNGMMATVSFPDMNNLSKDEIIDNIIQYFLNLKHR